MPKIILAIDGSDQANRALKRAARRAKETGSDLVVVGVAPLLAPEGGDVDPTARVAEMDRELAEAERRLREEGVHARVVRAAGDPAETILQIARDEAADEIFLGTVGRAAKPGSLRGSVARRVADKADAKVTLVE